MVRFLKICLIATIMLLIIALLSLLFCGFATPFEMPKKATTVMQSLQQPVIQSSVREEQIQLLQHFAHTLQSKDVKFWTVNSTLLATVKHGALADDDETLHVAILHDDLPSLVSLRAELQHGGTAQLLSGKHGYTYCKSNFLRFPKIEITLMARKGHEVSVCTPTDELGGCSFRDSFLRRTEVFDVDYVFPLIPAKLNGISVYVPSKAELCLVQLYGLNKVPKTNVWKWFNNESSMGIIHRFNPLASFL